VHGENEMETGYGVRMGKDPGLKWHLGAYPIYSEKRKETQLFRT